MTATTLIIAGGIQIDDVADALIGERADRRIDAPAQHIIGIEIAPGEGDDGAQRDLRNITPAAKASAHAIGQARRRSRSLRSSTRDQNRIPSNTMFCIERIKARIEHGAEMHRRDEPEINEPDEQHRRDHRLLHDAQKRHYRPAVEKPAPPAPACRGGGLPRRSRRAQ